MKSFYTEKHAATYNRVWKTFSQKTLAAATTALDAEALHLRAQSSQMPLHILDAGCGTGLLLEQLAHLFPTADCYGIDASPAMLAQARQRLQYFPTIHLTQATLTGETAAELPYPPAFFDLITCTNVLHYIQKPIAVLNSFKTILAQHGQLVLEDYTLRDFPFPWTWFEWAIRVYDPEHHVLFSATAAQRLCQQTGLHVAIARTFPIDLFCHGWVLRATHGEQGKKDDCQAALTA